MGSYQNILSSDFITNQLYLKLKKLILSKNNERLNTQFDEYEKRYLLDALQKPIEFSIEFYILLQNSKKWEYDQLFFLLTEFENQEEILKELKMCYNQSNQNEKKMTDTGKNNLLSKEEINQLPVTQLQKRITAIQYELKYLQKRNMKLKKEWKKNSTTLPIEFQDTQILKSSFASTFDKPTLAPPKKSPKSKEQKSPKRSPQKTEKEDLHGSGTIPLSGSNDSVNIVNNPIHSSVSSAPNKATNKLRKKGSQRSPRKYFKGIKSNESKDNPTQLSISLSSTNIRDDLSSGSATSESEVQRDPAKVANKKANSNPDANLRSNSNEIKLERSAEDPSPENVKEKQHSKPVENPVQKHLISPIELSTDNDTDKVSEISSSQNTDMDNKSVEINYLHEDTSSNEDTHSSTRRKESIKKLERERSLDISQITGENEETSESAYPHTPHPHLPEININFMGTSNDPIDNQALLSSPKADQPKKSNKNNDQTTLPQTQSETIITRKTVSKSKSKRSSKGKRKSKHDYTESETDTTESSVNSNNQSGSSKDRPIVNGNTFDYVRRDSSDNLRVRGKKDSNEDMGHGIFNSPVNQRHQHLKRHSSASSKKSDLVRRSLHLDLNDENKRKGMDDTIISPLTSARQSNKLPSASKTLDHSNISSFISSPFDMDGIGTGGRGNPKILIETLMNSSELNNEVKIRDLSGKKRKKINSCPKREQSIFENFNFSPRNVKNAIQTKLPELLTPRSIIHSPHTPSSSPKTPTNPSPSQISDLFVSFFPLCFSFPFLMNFYIFI